jgi:hypothetical protein
MNKEKLEKKKLALINEIIQLGKIRDEMWSYHPANKDRIDGEVQIPNIDKKVKSLEEEISQINNKL